LVARQPALILSGNRPNKNRASGEAPIRNRAALCYLGVMNLLLILVLLLLLFGGGGFYFGGPVVGGSGIGLILLICLVVYFAGGFRGSKN
jgi:hypothetical protein